LEWNYVEDGKLPEENTEVLISTRGKDIITVGYYFEEYGWKDIELNPKDVYAWAILPEKAPENR